MSRKQLKGVITSNKMEKTVVVTVTRTIPHPVYEKTVKRKKKYYAHTEQTHRVGDEVVIEECRPLSKLKRWSVAVGVSK